METDAATNEAADAPDEADAAPIAIEEAVDDAVAEAVGDDVDDAVVEPETPDEKANDVEEIPGKKRFRPEKCTEEEWDEGASLWRIYMKL